MYGAIATNKRNTILIMAVFVGIVSGIGYLVSLYFGDTGSGIFVCTVSVFCSK